MWLSLSCGQWYDKIPAHTHEDQSQKQCFYNNPEAFIKKIQCCIDHVTVSVHKYITRGMWPLLIQQKIAYYFICWLFLGTCDNVSETACLNSSHNSELKLLVHTKPERNASFLILKWAFNVCVCLCLCARACIWRHICADRGHLLRVGSLLPPIGSEDGT